MSHEDDREEFASTQKQNAIRLGGASAVFRKSDELLQSLNEYDYPYMWSWMGVPIIQLPADIMATQEVIWRTRPDVIIETGVARGGSVLFMASLLEMIGGGGKVIGVDIDIRKHNRESIEGHPMSKCVTLIEGGSVDDDVLEKVRAEIPEGAKVMVVLDSDHSREHVLRECRAYGAMVTPGCYLVIADTVVGHLKKEEAPTNRSKHWYEGNEPLTARDDFLSENNRFEIDPEVNGKLVLSSSPGGYLKCVSP
jgi:cephalosporin hydroxylase